MRKKKSKLKYRQLLIFTLLIILVSLFASFQFYKSTKTKRGSDSSLVAKSIVYPTLYSDKHITKNAIVSNPKFKNTIVFNKEKLTANVSSFIKRNKTFISSAKIENGVWLWTPILEITPEYRDSIIAGAKKESLSNIYLSIDSYLDIFVMEEGGEKKEKKRLFDETVESFIAKARKNNITVDAEGGWRNWAEEGHLYKAFAVLDYAIDFNKTHKEKFRGFQYDVEPYMLDYYQKNKSSVLKNFINLIDESVVRLDNTDLEFTVVIPEFYDGTSTESSIFFYGGKIAYAFDHLLSVLENRPGSKIIIMAYRNQSLGRDGSIEISKDEIARANKTETKIVIAQETGNVKPSYITFHNTSKSHYNKEIDVLEKAFESSKSFKGMAVHYINSFLELK